jgi:adenylate cyclase
MDLPVAAGLKTPAGHETEPDAKSFLNLSKPQLRRLRAAAMLLGLIAIVVIAPRVPPFSILETWFSDVELALVAPDAPPHPRLVIIDINEATVAKLKRRSPIDRSLLANLVDFVASADPAAIGIDILVDQPTDKKSDELLIASLKSIKVPTVLAWGETASAPNAIESRQQGELEKVIQRINNPAVERGLVNIQPDLDGIIRRMILRARAGEVRDGFALILSRIAGGRIPEGQDLPFAFYGHPTAKSEPFNVIQADVFLDMQGATAEYLRRVLTGKVVLIGASLLDTDRHRTPFALDPLRGPPRQAGVMIHAQAVAQLLDGREKHALPLGGVVLLALLVITAGFQLGRAELPEVARVVCAGAAIAFILTAAALTFRFGGAIESAPGPSLPVVAPILGFLTAGIFGIAHERKRLASDRQLVRSVVARYLPAATVDEQLLHPHDMMLGGDRREMSFVFTDIAGFTALCEHTDPKLLVPMLNEYLSAMTDVVDRFQGTVGGFIGDAVVAFWGAPAADPNHATHALQAAIEMKHCAKKLRALAKERGLDFGRTRIGVHTGFANVGNFGGPGHLEYMAHGDVVNTTSRLEGANKFLGTDIAVSEETAKRVGDVRLRPVAWVKMKGKDHTMMIYEPVEDMPADQLKFYAEAFDLLCEGSPTALNVFETFHRRWPSDRLVESHLKRLRKGEVGVIIKLRRK